MSEAQPTDDPGLTEEPRAKDQRLATSRDLRALLAVSEVATQSLDIEQVLNGTLNRSLEILGFDVGFIRIIDREKDGMVVRAAHGLNSPDFLYGLTPIHSDRRNVSRIVFETREAYTCADIRKNPVYKNRTLEHEGVISMAAAPVLSKGRILGIIVAGSRKYHRFAKREIHLLKAFGAQLGAALENAQLHGEVIKGKAYVENLVENAADVIVYTDPEDRILTWNRGAEVVLGYSKADAVGQHLSLVMPPERYHELQEMRAKVTISGALRDIEVRSKRKDGRFIDLSLSVSPIRDGDGNIVGFLRVAKDISEKKRFQRRLKDLDRMKSEFVSNVSHELRTPLTAIKGSVDNMLDGITGPLTEKQTRYLGRIKSNADRLARLITDLLDLSKIESGKIDLRAANLPVGLLITEVAEVLRSVAAEKLITIEFTGADENLEVWADRDKLIQILVNLIGNALKFTPHRGAVRIGVEPCDRDWVKLFVADTGPGIPAPEAARIFDKFYQLEQSNRLKAKGSGLGLTISKALVEMHGGKIWVESGIEGGCVFAFTLPARQPL